MTTTDLLRLGIVLLACGLFAKNIRTIMDAISQFCGGPPGPRHSLPANDAWILNRRRRG